MNSNICNCCGGEFEYRNGRWICRSCGSYKPEEISGEEVTLLYTAYQKLRLAEFSEAELEFDDFIQKYPENPHGYWGRLMAKYCIKYERDFDGRMIPTCYAASIGSILSSADYKKTLQFSDKENCAYYQNQAEYIERMRKEWSEKAKKEKPYDVFICYKDSDLAKGIERTKDSYAAQELYTLLTEMGLRVFYSRLSLRDKVGEKYEPYIFHALSTAQVMIVYGSDPEYINSTWLKNEWMRYARQIREGKKKPNSLLVACEGFSPEELPGTLSAMQCFRAEDRTFYGDLQERVGEILGCEESLLNKKTNNGKRKKRRKFRLLPLLIVLILGIWLIKDYIKINGPADLEFISNGDGTCYLSNITINGDTHIDIPAKYNGERVTEIGKTAFQYAYNLKSVTVPEGVTKIGAQAFAYCDDLTSVSLPNSLMVIEDSAFRDCTQLTEITIPENVTEIEEYAFYGCTKLASITIPKGVTHIGDCAFGTCKNLERVIIEGNLKGIGNSLFSDCKNLRSVIFNGDLQSIGSFMFSGCIELTSVSLPKTVSFVESFAFSGCLSLTEIDLPEGLKILAGSVFESCTALNSIRYGGTKEQWEKIDFGYAWNLNTGAYTVYCTDGSLEKNPTN